MAPPTTEKSHLKRPRVSRLLLCPAFWFTILNHLPLPKGSLPESDSDAKKPRRSERLSPQAADKTPVSNKHQLPSPVTRSGDSDDVYKEATATPPEDRPSQIIHRDKDDISQAVSNNISSPPSDTQAFSQYGNDVNKHAFSDEVEDEAKEGVWGYLLPLNTKYGKTVVLKKRGACPMPDALEAQEEVKKDTKGKSPLKKEEEAYERTKIRGVASGGYLIGRHPECDIIVNEPVVSNRHCLIFSENKGGDTVAILEDLSSNGTFVNEANVGRNKRRELEDMDEITIIDKGRFIFRYPKSRQTSAFLQQYTLLEKLGKGHFAEVFLCVEKSTGQRYAVKIFTKTAGMEERSKQEGLQQEIAVLMGVSHPNVLCLKDTFNERNAVYLVLELAPEGELFNFIVMKQKLTEDETRKLFKQLFQGIKYLHDRNIVHRDIKPENILMVDTDLHVKLADFGLAKIIGEESFTTTLCGTPSYVAPEILAEGRHRRYTKAVDIWSLGVVLYICLCGFPPFSDELYSKDFPLTLSQQIKSGKFDYPSPYWDSVGDPALDLIDSMLIVDPARRFTVDECLNHPWMTQNQPSVNDSTDGLVGGFRGLEMSRRGVTRERTLLASINSVQVTNLPAKDNQKPVKVYAKNKNKKMAPAKEIDPTSGRAVGEFIEMGGKGDEPLFNADGDSIYSKTDIVNDSVKNGKKE
ncbi:putative serine/threonine-protein kinase fhkC [Colletotrichum chlorophyti]|uniref:Putative serine/threonine-protein kinase fhkC n=1 Tax=Colletotrichum chlorophyti TaxID=708187 RepID=A0A1Q8RVX2_9PEZI|nr:putative serine/threonine-protein kinase fhkC [Colletotrichum chlorophyti]